MKLVNEYIEGLKKAYFDNGGNDTWQHFENLKEGASKEDIKKVKSIYPKVPGALIELLRYLDGTYWREFKGEKIIFYFLGSDVGEYSYYLLSSQQILKNKDLASEYYSEYLERRYDEVVIDDKITNQLSSLQWLHFSDCMNNGGTSQLFIDFSPSDKGKIGPVVRFLHDPDEFSVIADSFESYLQTLIDNNYDFIDEDIMD